MRRNQTSGSHQREGAADERRADEEHEEEGAGGVSRSEGRGEELEEKVETDEQKTELQELLEDKASVQTLGISRTSLPSETSFLTLSSLDIFPDERIQEFDCLSTLGIGTACLLLLWLP